MEPGNPIMEESHRNVAYEASTSSLIYCLEVIGAAWSGSNKAESRAGCAVNEDVRALVASHCRIPAGPVSAFSVIMSNVELDGRAFQ